MFGQSPGYAEGKIFGRPFFFFGENENQWQIEVSLSPGDEKTISLQKESENLIDGPFECVDGNVFKFGSTHDIQECFFDFWETQERLISCSKHLKEKLKINE